MLVEVFLGVILLWGLWTLYRKPSNYPPGFWGLPLVGYIPLDTKPLFDRLLEARKWAGDVLLWRMGTRNMVFLFDYHTVKKLFSSQEFAGRPNYIAVINFFDKYQNTGIVGSNGALWHETRRFSLRVLKDLGMGKSKMIDDIQYEALDFIKHMKERSEEPAPMPKALAVNMLNVSWKLVANIRYTGTDPELHRHEELLHQSQSSVNVLTTLDLLPWISSIVPAFLIRKYVTGPADTAIEELKIFFQDIIDDHKQNLDVNDPKDFIDEYLIEMEEQKDTPDTVMTDQNLLATVADLYLGGSETGIATLQWILFYLVAYPDVQKRLQQEVDQVLTEDSLATLDNQHELHYTKAVIYEVQRMSGILPSAGFREASEDVQVGEHIIPKGSMVMPVLLALHYDPQFWKNPNDFQPQRFLAEDGKFVAPKNGFMPFGLGKRVCVGEAIARIELIIFLTTIMKNLTLSAPPGKPISLKPGLLNFFFCFPDRAQHVVFTRR